MSYRAVIAVFFLAGILEAFAIPSQQRSLNLAPWDCGRVSFTQKGQNTHIYSYEEVDKKCYNLQSVRRTALMLNEHTYNCAYKVRAFSMNHCDEDSDYREYPMNPGNRVVHLNKMPICSFYIGTLPLDGTYIAVNFRESSATKTHYVYRDGCYNICNGPSNFNYPDTVQLYRSNENIAHGYSVKLFSTMGCEDELTKPNHELSMKRNGELDLKLITHQAQTLSYAIFKM